MPASSFYPELKRYPASPPSAYALPLHDVAAVPSADFSSNLPGPPPATREDFATTAEETPVIINILENDEEGSGDDDDDDADDDDDNSFRIDRSTVDLQPDQPGRQSTHITGAGAYSVNDDGFVTFVPALNFFGAAAIQYTVGNRREETSSPTAISLTVININDAPVIAGFRQSPIQVLAGQPLTITLDQLIISDPDNHAPSDFSLIVLAGDNYTVSGATVTPDAGFSGSLPVMIRVTDGFADSDPVALTLLVADDNTTPVITGQQAATTPEDQAFTIGPELLTVSDPDNSYPDGFTTQVADGDGYSVSGTIVTPDANFSGTLTVPVTVNDGQATSEPFSFVITVTPVNDPPVISGQSGALSTGQGNPIALSLADVVVSDPDHSVSELALAVLPGDNYTFAGLTVTPAPAFSGLLAVNVAVTDLAGGTAPFALSVSVSANMPPVITGQARPLSTNEETALTISLSDLVVSDPDNADPASLTLQLSGGSGYTVDGLVIIPAPNFSGDLSVPVVVNDGISNSSPFPLKITVLPVNDAPKILGHATLTTAEGQTLTLNVTDLTVEDPDDVYPEDFTLKVISGDNYSASGNQITPVAGFNGPLTVGVMVNDGSDDSNQFSVNILVTPVNNPPQITGQVPLPLVTAEETAISLRVENLTISDPDNDNPAAFTIIIQPGANYVFSGTTITPSADFVGDLEVSVIVNDGVANSAPFPLIISVTPVNDAPRITGPSTLSISEDVARTIALADLQFSDPDNVDGFTLLVFPGLHYTLSGNTIIPEKNYNGPLPVQVQVTDGIMPSDPFTIQFQVLPVNDAPSITGQVPVETPEDVPVTIQLSHLTIFDVDNTTGFSLLISPGEHYIASGSTITPAIDFNGTLNINVVVSDGLASSPAFIFQIQVGDANDAPVITGQATLSTNEETPVALNLSYLAVSDPDNIYPNGFSLLISAGTNYTVSGQTITPVVNFSGVLSIPVRVNDGINNSATFDFQLTVNSINDPPVFAAIANQQVAENSPAGSLVISGISKGPMEDYQQLTFVATSGNTSLMDDPVIRYEGGSTAILSYAVKPNASGVITVTIVAIDNGSNSAPHRNSYTSGFQIEVTEINSAPTLDNINNMNLLEDAEQQHVTLTGITAGAGETQPLTVSVEASRPDLFDLLEIVYATPGATGQLHFKLKPDVSGTVQLSIAVMDNGSGISPHVNRVVRSFSVVISPVNDPSVFTSEPLAIAVINEDYRYHITATDPDNEALTISATVKPSWASIVGGNNGEAILSGRPTAAALGNTEVKIQVKDAVTAVEQSFTIYVNARPAIAALTLATEEDTQALLPDGFFNKGYTDLNGDLLTEIIVTTLPASGRLSLAEQVVQTGDTIPEASLAQLLYTPAENFFGSDSFAWKAFDGYHSSLSAAQVDISVHPVNDPPQIVFERDTLLYEVNGESALLSPLVEIIDPDDDTLHHASIGFHQENYRAEVDRIEYVRTENITSSFDFQSGVLHLTGIAPVDEYRAALRSIRYLHQNTIDPLLVPKQVFFALNDGEADGERADKVIMLQYTFVEFEIPSGFTPNGDQANDTWVIDRPGGGLEEMDKAIVSIYNKQGVLVYRTEGFGKAWDGTMNGVLLPADTYFYTIDLQLRNRKTYKGIVTILR